MDQDVAHLWQLINELSDQLTSNRELTEALKNQALNVKGQAVHSGVGFPLRRFNIDITDEQFTSELERFASHLVLENQNLAYENKQLNLLLKEYEQTLEGVMGKFRGVCHAATQHELTLHQYYTSLLQQLQTTHSTSSLHDSTTLSTLLQRLSTLIRAALRNVNGEDEEFEHPGFDMPMTAVDRPSNLADVIADIQNITQSSPTNRPRTAGTIGNNDKWLGDQGVSGGYSGKSMARLDWSIEREGEIIRLEDENRLLREMLGVAKDVDPATLLHQSEKQKEEDHEEKASSPELPAPPVTGPSNNDDNGTGVTEGYNVEDEKKEHDSPEATETDKATSSSEETASDRDGINDSAIAEEDEEALPSSPPMTATASLVRSLSTSPQSQFKSSPKLPKYATYSGSPPKSPSMNRAHASMPNVSQSSSAGTIGTISSPNASLANIFPRQAKTEPTTATTTTVELEDSEVVGEAQKPASMSAAPPRGTPSNLDSNGVSKSRIEIKKVQTPPLPGSPLGKTPPKTGISFDYAVESRAATSRKEEQSDKKPDSGTGNADKQDHKKEQKPDGTKADQKRDGVAKKAGTGANQSGAEEEKPSYADVAKEETTEN